MRFNATLNVDFAKWTQVKMERENNIKEFKGIDEEMPKYVISEISTHFSHYFSVEFWK